MKRSQIGSQAGLGGVRQRKSYEAARLARNAAATVCIVLSGLVVLAWSWLADFTDEPTADMIGLGVLAVMNGGVCLVFVSFVRISMYTSRIQAYTTRHEA